MSTEVGTRVQEAVTTAADQAKLMANRVRRYDAGSEPLDSFDDRGSSILDVAKYNECCTWLLGTFAPNLLPADKWKNSRNVRPMAGQLCLVQPRSAIARQNRPSTGHFKVAPAYLAILETLGDDWRGPNPCWSIRSTARAVTSGGTPRRIARALALDEAGTLQQLK
jgi:hypothetical protein